MSKGSVKGPPDTSAKANTDLGHLGVLSHNAAMQNVQLAKTGPLNHGPSHRLPATILPSLDLTLHVTKQGRRCRLHSQKNSPFTGNYCLTDLVTCAVVDELTNGTLHEHWWVTEVHLSV